MLYDLQSWLNCQRRHIGYAWQECQSEQSPFKWWKISDIYGVYKFEKAIEERDELESETCWNNN